MLYSKLVKRLNIKKSNISNDTNISAICSDNRKVKQDSVYVCIKGAHFDGHDFADDAIIRGAKLVISEKELSNSIPHIVVEDTRHAFAIICSAFYDYPQESFKYSIGLTGTNGKTSTSCMLKSIFETAGYKTGLIGTMKYLIGDEEYVLDKDANLLTTPESDVLFELLAKMRDEGVECLIMEVSSHSLELKKVDGIHFKAGIFTNFTQDHIDFHGSMQKYKEAKKKLFDRCDIGIFNADDVASAFMMDGAACKCLTYGVEMNEADYTAKNVNFKGAYGVDYELLSSDLIFRIKMKMPGNFTVYNSLAAASCALTLGIDSTSISQGLEKVETVNGRLERLETDTDYSVFIDFAHTPDALENVLKSVRSFTSGRVITLFGCGGNRDHGKRPLMGGIASDYSDFVIVTSDNSRLEEKDDIINDILKGMENKKTPFEIIPDRTDAIKYALNIAEKDDAIILAGKGHEEYEIDKFGKRSYSERQIVFDFLSKKTF